MYLYTSNLTGAYTLIEWARAVPEIILGMGWERYIFLSHVLTVGASGHEPLQLAQGDNEDTRAS